uniref:Uncharacterized protein n=1 Tax=Brassica oleracea TaxID=3712 RepID=A0A3P6E0I3_BRAOL|nr:unnamed protein product [Brassica oleracea]
MMIPAAQTGQHRKIIVSWSRQKVSGRVLLRQLSR